MNNKKKESAIPVTRNCRYLDGHRRTIIPAPVLEEAGVPTGCVLEAVAYNGCIVLRPVVGIVVPNHLKEGRMVRKGQ